MSRHTALDFETDYTSYHELILKAVGNRSQKAFSKSARISYSYFNRYMNDLKDGKHVPPFSPNLLMRVARASDNRVGFEEIMTAAGFDCRKHMVNKQWYGYEDATVVMVRREDDAKIWVATCEELGFVVESTSYDALTKRVLDFVPQMARKHNLVCHKISLVAEYKI